MVRRQLNTITQIVELKLFVTVIVATALITGADLRKSQKIKKIKGLNHE